MYDDEIKYQEEKHEELIEGSSWRILIVDDDKEVHAFSRIVLNDFTFLEKKVHIFSAYSEEEACYLLKHHEFSVVFLDVMMENDNSGFKLAEYIRDELKNKYIQIVIRTGEANLSTEEEIFKKYKVNAYCEKTLLTRDKLIAQLHSSLSHYHQFSELIAQKEMLSLGIVKDQLTGAFNRYKFEEDIVRLISRFDRYGEQFSVIMLDIDYFKNINDIYGHQTGDMILLELVDILQKNIRKSDLLIRWGGEEFIILLPLLGIEESFRKAEDLRTLIEENSFKINLTVTCSFGVIGYTLGCTKEKLIHKVDKVMYKAKQNGRNRVEKEAPDVR